MGPSFLSKWETYQNVKHVLANLKTELKTYQLVLKDPRTPKLAKWLLAGAVAYFVSPVDLIPDFIPVLGQLDDLAVISTLVSLALRMIPKEVVQECRERAKTQTNPPMEEDA